MKEREILEILEEAKRLIDSDLETIAWIENKIKEKFK